MGYSARLNALSKAFANTYNPKLRRAISRRMANILEEVERL